MNGKLMDEFLYELLQVSPSADMETIEKVYRILAKRYHPDNTATGDIDKFTEITNAYKILTDPEKRAAYDLNYEKLNHQQWNRIAKIFSPDGYENDKEIRRIILTILYIQRRESPSDSGVGPWSLEKMTGWPEAALKFHLWYLKEKKLIIKTDSGGFAITVEGVDQLEADGSTPGRTRLLTQITKSLNPQEPP